VRRRIVVALVLALTALALTLGACGGDDDEATTMSTAPSAGAPSGGTRPSGDLGALPPGFVECMRQQGYEITSSADIHSAPPEVLQACFGATH
jgi:hypothetical protein